MKKYELLDVQAKDLELTDCFNLTGTMYCVSSVVKDAERTTIGFFPEFGKRGKTREMTLMLDDRMMIRRFK